MKNEKEVALDIHGQMITPGDRVVYNLSGELATGTVVEVKITGYRNQWNSVPEPKWLIKIKMDGEHWGQTDHISKVRNPKGIYVLYHQMEKR